MASSRKHKKRWEYTIRVVRGKPLVERICKTCGQRQENKLSKGWHTLGAKLPKAREREVRERMGWPSFPMPPSASEVS